MRHFALFGLLLVTLLSIGAAPNRSPPAYRSLTREFAHFYDATRSMPEAARVALFRKRFDALFPGFYEPADGQTGAQFNTSVANALAKFPEIRARYEQTERDFPRAYAAGIRHFRAQFPGFRPSLPIWFVHSLGRMDGGTRTLRGKNVMIFGADVIARIHDSRDIGPFLDHEMFHVENAQWFKDCDAMWCALWQEGLATYAASVMNPGADDHLLMLDQPAPIRAKVDADWRTALCQVRRDLMSTDQKVYGSYFYGREDPARIFPARWGYYVGLRIMQRLGKDRTLRDLDHLANGPAKVLLAGELTKMIGEAGGCPGD
ncbi:MAG: hypothetical protein ACTHJR_13570 [Sphingomonas sp.]|uniref:hypothetical protein n=1 Tax=Sphingomonas sp. TaxID=28214 RepID=UPI003F7F23C9